MLGAAGFHAVAPDLRGYGGTDRPKHGYDLDTLAADIYQLARHLQPGRPAYVVGHDWGGAIAYHLAAHHPEVVDKLAVINCPHPAVMARRLWNPAQLARSWYMFFFQLPWLPERKLSQNDGAAVPRTIRRALVHKERVPLERLQPYADNFANPEAARAALAYYRSAIRGVMTPWGLRRMLSGYPASAHPSCSSGARRTSPSGASSPTTWSPGSSTRHRCATCRTWDTSSRSRPPSRWPRC